MPAGSSVSYGELAAAIDLHVEATPGAVLKKPDALTVIGTDLKRVDIPAKVTGGAAYVQDLRLEGMLHARVVRPPSYGASLDSLDASQVEKMPGVVAVAARR